MSVQPFYNPKFRAFDANGNPLSGGLLYTYEADTETPLATYTTRAGNVANANPVVLDANGEANVWTTPGVSYKFVLKNSSAVVQWTVDNVPSPSDLDTLPDGSIRLPDGDVGEPSLSFTADTDSGLYRYGSNNPAMSAGGEKVQDWSPGGTAITGNVTLHGYMSVTGPAATQGIAVANGTDATGATRQDALVISNGDITMASVANPSTTTGITNRLTPKNIPKAWVVVEVAAGPSVVIRNGFNITSIAVSGNEIQINLADDMANAYYAADPANLNLQLGSAPVIYGVTFQSTSNLRVGAVQFSGGAYGTVNISTSVGLIFGVTVFGEQ